MSYLYLHHWRLGPGAYERSGNVIVWVDQAVIRASHVHARQGFPFNRIPGAFWTSLQDYYRNGR